MAVGALVCAVVPVATAAPTRDQSPGPAANATVSVAHVPRHFDPRPVRPRTATALAKVAAAASPVPASTDVLALSSRPGADRTIYLDFTGGAVPAGTLWSYADPIPYGPYTTDDDPTVGSNEVERTAIFQSWQSVVEDFAPFDVNVTTANPGTEALARTNAQDARFGVHTIVTPAGSAAHQRTCGQTCGGVAILDVMDMATVQPVWVFSYPWRSGRGLGKTSSHEIGHALGLFHDGRGAAEYFTGSNLWGPIMGGAMDSAPLAHWSPGDYADATTAQQDDLSVIGESFPRLPDDHGGPEAPTPIADTGVGVIGDRADTDAFAFSAHGKVTISVGGAPGATNLDAGLLVTRADGSPVVYTDNPPQSIWKIDELPGYLPATWRGRLGEQPVPLVAVVDGVGVADPEVGYSDYGSLGAYTFTVRPGPSAPRWKKVRWSRSQRYRWWTGGLEVTGSEGPLTITRVGDKPPGVKVTVSEDGRAVRFRGFPQRVGVYRMRLTATDAWGDATTRKVVFRFSEFQRKHGAPTKNRPHGGKHGSKHGGRHGTKSGR